MTPRRRRASAWRPTCAAWPPRRRPPARRASRAATGSVVDAWQGRGVGRVLLTRLAARACEVGVTRFSASLLTDNRAMLALFARLGEIEVRHDSGATIALHVRF